MTVECQKKCFMKNHSEPTVANNEFHGINIDEVGDFVWAGLRKEDKDQLDRIESRLDGIEDHLDRIEYKINAIRSNVPHRQYDQIDDYRGVIVARDM